MKKSETTSDSAAQHRTLLAKEISAIFREGLTLSPDVLRYVNTTFSNPALSELEAILNDESDCEREPLLELIFFPDEDCQIRLEPLLSGELFCDEDQEPVSQQVCSTDTRVPLRFPDGSVLAINLPADAASRFVSRLNISSRADPRLIAAISSHVGEKHRSAISVKLRNARLRYYENHVDFLRIFFEKLATGYDEFFESLDFVLSFLSEIKADDDIRAVLEKRRDFHFLAIRKASEFEEQVGGNNMETLMVQGVRIPHIDREKLMREIVVIDRIRYLMYQPCYKPKNTI